MKLPHHDAICAQFLDPVALKMCYPKRIACPNGFYDPKFFAAINASRFRQDFEDLAKLVNGSVLARITALNVKYQCPTYFVDPKFAEAVFETEPPEFTVGEVKLPMPAFQLCLSEKFTNERFKATIPFVMVAKIGDVLCWGYMVMGKRKGGDSELMPYAEFNYRVPGKEKTTVVKEPTPMTEDDHGERLVDVEPPAVSDQAQRPA